MEFIYHMWCVYIDLKKQNKNKPEMARYRCGCFSETIFHDEFTNTDEMEYNNICGQHPSEESAKEDHVKKSKIEEVLEKAGDVFKIQMDADTVAYHLSTRNLISKETKKQRDED